MGTHPIFESDFDCLTEEFRQAFKVGEIQKQLDEWTNKAAQDLKELQEKSTIENIQFEIESGLADLAEKIQKFNDEVADWDDDNQKFIQAEMIKMKENLFRSVQMRRKLEIQRPFYFSITNKCQDVKKKGDWICPFGNIPLFVGKVTNPITTE